MRSGWDANCRPKRSFIAPRTERPTAGGSAAIPGARKRRTRPGATSISNRGVPRFEIEGSPGRVWRFLAAGMAALPPAVGRSVRGAMKLRFGRQFASQPLRIRGGLGVAHVHRPLLRQTNLAKHRMINPQVALAPPEHRMLDAFLR